MRKIRARQPLISFGITMLGPVLLEYGNEAQKREHLPKIVRGEIRWCQGYSEPGAGSDLAGLQTRAEDKGDHYLVNGQKIWTSYANYADWIFCLVRTDPNAAKHDGISFLLFDMESPGVSVSPIKLISGTSPFCQTFFQDVKVPKANLVGTLNGGWTIAKRLLQHEREMIGGMGFGLGGGGTASLEQVAKEYVGEDGGRIADAGIREQVAQHLMDQRCFMTTVRRSAEEAKAGQGPGPASSMFKLYGTEMNKRRYELLVKILGTNALRLGRRRLHAARARDDARVAALEGQLDRGRHQRSAAQHHRQARARPPGLAARKEPCAHVACTDRRAGARCATRRASSSPSTRR